METRTGTLSSTTVVAADVLKRSRIRLVVLTLTAANGKVKVGYLVTSDAHVNERKVVLT